MNPSSSNISSPDPTTCRNISVNRAAHGAIEESHDRAHLHPHVRNLSQGGRLAPTTQCRVRYRDYKKEPLSRTELEALFSTLGVAPGTLLRKHDAVAKAQALDERTPDEMLLDAMAAHPTLLQRPIGVLGVRAVVGRPPERLLTLLPPGGLPSAP